MACFLVPAAEAVIITAVQKAEEKKEIRDACGQQETGSVEESIPFSRKLKWLTYMLWGGIVLLAFEHIWHGEVVPWFPFLTAMSNPADASVMFHEMVTVGVMMAVLVTLVWIGMCFAADAIVRRPAKSAHQTSAL